MFCEASLQDAYKDVKRGISIAPHVFQKNLLDGFAQIEDVEVDVLNIPPVGSFPINNKRLFAKTYRWGKNNTQIGYLNLPFIKHGIHTRKLFKEISRRIEAETDPVLWLKTHLPKVFFADFSQSQIDFINQSWEAIENRSYKNINAYRGFGKTSIQCGLLLLSHLTGHTKHAVYITAEGSNSTRNASEWFQNALYEDYECPLEDASPLCQDYPEVYYPIQRRGGVAQRPLKYNGEPCSIVISPERIVFPTIKGSPSSGALIRFTSIGSSSIRGTHHAIRGEGITRVDIAFLDDVQSDGTAKSETEVSTIVETIKSTVRLLGGRSEEGGKQPLIVLSALTQNQPDDVAVRIIDEMPSFATEIFLVLTGFFRLGVTSELFGQIDVLDGKQTQIHIVVEGFGANHFFTAKLAACKSFAITGIKRPLVLTLEMLDNILKKSY